MKRGPKEAKGGLVEVLRHHLGDLVELLEVIALTLHEGRQGDGG